MGAIFVAVVADIAFVALAIVLWRRVGERVRTFFDKRLPTLRH